jgi:hypothetical protein
MKKLSFTFQACKESHDHEVRIQLDGVDILTTIDKTSLGLDPVEFFAQDTLHKDGELLIGRCSCGCVGCGDTSVRTHHDDEKVVWKSEYRWLSEIVFSKRDYLSAIEAGKSETSWETLERTTERLVGQLDFSGFSKKGMIFQWASARIDPEKIALSFLKSGKQELLYFHWNHADSKSAVAAAQIFIENETGA